LGNVHTHTAYSNRMQRLPGKHCDSHDTYRRRVEDKTDYLTGNAEKICGCRKKIQQSGSLAATDNRRVGFLDELQPVAAIATHARHFSNHCEAEKLLRLNHQTSTRSFSYLAQVFRLSCAMEDAADQTG